MNPVPKDLESRTRPRPRRLIRRQLAEISQVKKAVEEYGGADFATELAMLSVDKEERLLREELRAAEMLESENDIELSLEGRSVQDHMVKADLLGNFLADLQALVKRVYFSLTGESLADQIGLESQIMVAGVKPGSFTVLLRLSPPSEAFDMFSWERRAEVLMDLHQLFDDETSSQDLTKLLTETASKSFYKRLLTVVEEHDTGVVLRTKVDPYGSTRLSPEVAATRKQWMEESEKETEEELVLDGDLVGGNVEKGTFVLKTATRTYTGKVSEDARGQMRSIKYGARVKALVVHKTDYRTKATSDPIERTTLASIVSVTEGPVLQDSLIEDV